MAIKPHLSLLITLQALFLNPALGLSLEDGDQIPSSPGCDGNVLTAMKDICKLVDFAGAGCSVDVDICAKGTRELFSGTLIEFASPKNIKVWNGLGGLGGFYNSAAVCMMHDLDNLPGKKIVTHAETDTIEAQSQQVVAITGFDPKTGSFSGYHRLKACGPIVGCLDVYTQKFSLLPVSSKISNLKAGQYDIQESYALQLTSDGVAQIFTTLFPKIDVPTPIGVVTVQPVFTVGRAAGLLSAPFNQNAQTNYPSMFLPTQQNKTYDVYGRNPGAKVSTLSPIDTALNDPTWTFTQKGWISTLAMGGRDPGTTHPIWNPGTPGTFPLRPDLDPTQPRSKVEKTPGAYLRAAANIEYSIANFLPSALKSRLKCSGFVELCLQESGVYAKPAIDLVYSSQLSFFQNEQSYWNGTTDGKEFALPKLTPDTFDQAKELKILANSTVSAMTSLESGLNFAIQLKVKGPFGFTKPLVNIHPRIIVPLASESAFSPDTKILSARSLASAVVSQGKFFQEYRSWNGKNLADFGKDGGTAAIQECFKSPLIKETEPPTPKSHPGNPDDWAELIEQPCNICVAWDDIHYKDELNKEQVEPKGNYTVFPASKKAFKDTDQWACLQSAQLGCYDTCQVSKDGKLTVKHTAVQLLASGQAKDMPKSCKIYNPTIGN